MQAKLFAWTNCSVAEFMLKLPFPPPFAVVRAGISQLKNLDLFDKWEDLVDLGAYCLALPIVELPYAMMIIYAHLFKCLEPILIIVSTLTIGDPCKSQQFLEINFELHILVQSNSKEVKQRLGSNKNSDHFLFYQLYQVVLIPCSHISFKIYLSSNGNNQLIKKNFVVIGILNIFE
jgi:HrpA-like RNA helicase